jgi:tricorn protease
MNNLFIFLLAILNPCSHLYARADAKFMRFPNTNGKEIVFTLDTDLYTVPISGGDAKKLTSHLGMEIFAKYSPDGEYIAFTGQYDGNSEVYLIPSKGGTPRRLTYTPTLVRDDVSDRMGPNNVVTSWHPDGKRIVFRTRGYSFNDFKGHLYSVNTSGDYPEQLPFSVGGFNSFSPDGSKIAYNQIFREFRTWKYYQGGMADDVYIYDFVKQTTENITSHPSQDIFPMWHKGKIYFCSDRDRTMNIFCYDITTKQTKKITNYTDYDVKFPSLGGEYIAFEKGGDLYLLNLTTEKASKVDVNLNDDAGMTSAYVNYFASLQSLKLSNDGNRLATIARGDLFSVPTSKGVVRHLIYSSRSHERGAVWAPNGKFIAYISDVSGEDEIYIVKPDGTEKPKQITSKNNNYIFKLEVSPDSKKILYCNKNLELKLVDIETGKTILIDKAESWEFNQFTFSANSDWVAYVRPYRMAKPRLHLYEIATQKSLPITEEWYDASNPSFSSDGNYLFFVSSRDYSPTYSWTEWNHAYYDMHNVFAILLNKDANNPLLPKSVEVGDTAIKKMEEACNFNIDLKDIEKRIVAIPIPAGQYSNLTFHNRKLYYGYRTVKDKKLLLKAFDFENQKESDFGAFDDFSFTSNAKYLLINESKKYYSMPTPATEKIELKDPIDVADYKASVNYRAEYEQIFHEAWRQMRDFFYAPNMHGVNWESMREKYATLLPFVNHRTDLTYIIGELIGELNCGHAYVGDGDWEKAERIPLGLLGADIKKDNSSGYYKITKILRGDIKSGAVLSPLATPGINIKEGDYILSISGVSLKDIPNPYSLLVGKAGKQVEIAYNNKPSVEGMATAIIVPISDESSLRYFDWVHGNVEYVSNQTNGDVGYLHIPNMLTEGLNSFVKYFYAQLNKKALIIDNRGNGGGNVSPMIVERLRREIDMMLMSRNTEPYPSPQLMYGPKVLLLDRYSASDGDLFPWRFKHYKIGTTIGERSWGGTVGIRGSLPFVDGGTLSKPEFSRFDITGKEWIIEGYGVDPDIEIRNDPALEFKGRDLQLEKAITIAKEQIANQKPLPKMPTFPDKSK